MNPDDATPDAGGSPESTPPPAPPAKPRWTTRDVVVRVLVYGGILGLLAAIAIPNFIKPRATECKNSCIANLKQIDGAIQQWALEHKKSVTDAPELAGVLPYLKGSALLKCPGGGTYHLGKTIGDSPLCRGNKDKILHELK